MIMNRRGFLAGSAALCGSMSACSQTSLKPVKRIAVTMDDFWLSFDVRQTPLERNEAILNALARHNHKAAGFVTGKAVNMPIGQAVVKSWADAGHLIGNHSYSHMNSSKIDVDVIKADFLKNHRALSDCPTYEKIIRFPFLAEGGTLDKIEAYREFMTQNGFANAPVTIDSIDWAVAERIQDRLKSDPNAELIGYRDYYVKSVIEIASYQHELALRLGYTDLPHTLLVHHTILNGLFLGDVMDALVDDGWVFVDAKEALAHPVYKLRLTVPTRGRSLLSVLAQERGVDDTEFPKAYHGAGKETMAALGL